MKKIILPLLSLFVINKAAAQQDRQFTHYNFDKMSFNPAATGFKGYCGTLIYRNQWDKVQDAPNTTLLNLQGHIPNQNFGVGISMSNEVIGFQKNNSIIVNGAYHFPTHAGILSGGIGIGIINIGFDPDWVPPQTFSDPLLPDAISQSIFDVNAGIYWHATHAPYYVGISTTHIKPQTLSNINFTTARHYYVLAGYDFRVKAQRRIDIKPSMLIKADGATAIFDLNVNTDIWINNYSYLWGGFTYRLQDAVAFSAGYAFSPRASAKINMLKIGYSFDIMTNELSPYGRGSHELMLNFCMFPPPPPKTRHGNPFVLE